MKLFGTSGIRGKYGETVTEGLALDVGRAMGTLLDGTIAVGMDSRTSGPSLKSALISGLLSQGIDVYDLGLVPTPTVGVAIREYGCSAGVVITASHNPSEYNGIKVWDERGVAFHDLEGRIEATVADGSFSVSSWNGVGELVQRQPISLHMKKIMEHNELENGYSVAVDCGCGAGSVITPYLLEKMGARVFSLNCQPSGFFPRGLEPNETNLSCLSNAVRSFGCDLGVANDGDADRIGAVDEKGRFIDYDHLLAMVSGFECEISKSTNPKVVTTVDASMCLDNHLEQYGGEVIRTEVGDVALARSLVNTDATFGGEPSGTWIFPSHWLTPDGVLAAVRLLGMKDSGFEFHKEREKMPSYVTMREKIYIDNVDRESFYDDLLGTLNTERFESILDIDGIRVDYGDSWVLYRFSGTEPLFRITVEAGTGQRAKEVLETARKRVGELLRKQ
ncbi:MAG TPA: phosphoglucosamine mutase [Candidatus Methanofastidiosa archaeon]|nr:phosphoglucosamine mutase [Candidatus Methanofastidiosa archaeon]